MDSFSPHRQLSATIVFLVVILLFVLFFFWLFFLNGTYMLTSLVIKEPYEEYPNSSWVSEDPVIFMTIPESPLMKQESYVVIDGERIPVSIYVMRAESHVIISTFSPNEKTHTILLEGNDVRVSGSEISFHVTTDVLFDGMYSTIVLKRQK